MYIININKYYIFGLSILKIIGLIIIVVFVGNSKINKNNIMDFIFLRIFDIIIGIGLLDYSSD